MKMRALSLIALLVSSVCLSIVYVCYQIETDPSNEDFFFGVTFGGNTTSEAKLLIDKVKGYTNLFVVDNWDVAMNETVLTEICEYAVDANLSIMVYFSFVFFTSTQLSTYNPAWLELFVDAGVEPFHIPWLSTAWERWGDKFLGAYVLDEPGGNQIDVGYYTGFTTGYSGRNITAFEDVANYSDAAYRFVRGVGRYYVRRLNDPSRRNSIPNMTGRIIPVFTADNALYWFDYLAGYDAVFAELGWDHNQAQHISLCRGAANVQGKEWGAIITWASNDPPYLASGTEMLQDMNTAYRSGAKYLIVFNYPQINPYGALTEEHFTAMKKFWDRIHRFPGNVLEKVDGQVALVLPKDYGWGMRSGDDKIWGIWPPDDLSPVIGEKAATLINKYGLELDIIYDDPQFNFTEKYSKIYFWNSTASLSPQSAPSIPPPYELYTVLVIAAITITGVPSYFVMKRRKRRPTESIFLESAAKASLKNLGSGTLELIDNTIKFYLEKGYFKKRKEIAREIPIADIESIERVGNELSITWKGVTDIFAIEETEVAGIIHERITEALKEQRKMLEDREAAKQKRNELTKILSIAIELVDSLFDVLRSLQGRVDWNRVEGYLKRSEENVKSFTDQKMGTINLDFTKLSLAIKEHLSEEISKETYNILRSLYEYFSGLTSKNKFLEQIHPNYHDAKTTILAHYILNDIILATIVGDEKIEKESNELAMMLDDLSKGTDLKINVDAIKDTINKLGVEKGKESVIEESRAVFRQQLKELITA